MRYFSIAGLAIVFCGMLLSEGFGGLSAILLVSLVSAVVIVVIRSKGQDVEPLIDIFLVALLLRLAFGLFIHVYELREFFGGDAFTYDAYGVQIADVIAGKALVTDSFSVRAMSTGTPGWGIHFLTGFIYYIFGPNLLAAQSLVGAIGAATAPLLYYCAKQIFNNSRVGTISAMLYAMFPAAVVWSSQLLKDGLMVFLLVVSMTMVLAIQKRFSWPTIITLLSALAGIIALRFYIFYLVAISVVGALVIGRAKDSASLVRGFAVLFIIAVGLIGSGAIRTASDNLQKFGDIELLQRSRKDLSKSADSGFGGDVDISTTEGALTNLPTGFSYLMFAPFPWEATSLRQSVTIPETLIWWAMFPIMLMGLAFTLRSRLRPSIPVLTFTIMLTLAYSVMQGNVGTAYRQRIQIQVFLFMFVAAGVVLLLERSENNRMRQIAAHRRSDERLKALSSLGREGGE